MRFRQGFCQQRLKLLTVPRQATGSSCFFRSLLAMKTRLNGIACVPSIITHRRNLRGAPQLDSLSRRVLAAAWLTTLTICCRCVGLYFPGKGGSSGRQRGYAMLDNAERALLSRKKPDSSAPDFAKGGNRSKRWSPCQRSFIASARLP